MKKQAKEQSGLGTTHLDWNQNQQAAKFQSPASPLFVLPKNHINQVRSKRRAQIAPAFVSLHRSQTHLISSERPCQAAHIILLPQQRFYCSGSGRGSRSWTIQLGFNSFRLWVAACEMMLRDNNSRCVKGLISFHGAICVSITRNHQLTHFFGRHASYLSDWGQPFVMSRRARLA